jgi:hypothetical protein
MRNIRGIIALFAFVFIAASVTGCGGGGSDGIPLIEEESSELSGMNIYFGSLNGSSGASGSQGGDGYAQQFIMARNSLMDFYAITDNSDDISNDEWERLKEASKDYTKDGSFVAIRGFCFNDPHFGHASIIGTENFITYEGFKMESLNSLYSWIDDNAALAQFNHPGEQKGVFNDLACSEDASRSIFAIETANNNNSCADSEYYPYYVAALDKGWKVAPSANQEKASAGENTGRTALIAENLKEPALLDAMRMRRVYATDDINTRIIFKSGDEWMGSTLSPSTGSAEILLMVSDDEPIIRLEIITNRGMVIALKEMYDFAGNLDTTGIEYVNYMGREWIKWKVNVSSASGSYYFARTTGKNTLDNSGKIQVSLTAPIWFGDVEPVSGESETLAQIEQEMLNGNKIYFGNIHGHSNVSDGENPPETDFILAQYSLMDFYAITDHSEFINASEWAVTGKVADSYNKDGKFVAFRGFEWSHPLTGHICIYGTEDYTTFLLTGLLSVRDLYKWAENRDALAQFNHPGRESGIFDDLALYDAAIDNFIAMETGNKDVGNNDLEYFPYYVTALDKGWKVAPTSNLDNHTPTANSHRTAIMAGELTRKGLFEAMKARRVYSTDDPNIRLILKSGSTFMGSSAAATGMVQEISLMISDDEPVQRIEIITNGGAIAAEKYVYDANGNFNPSGIQYAEYMDTRWILYRVAVPAAAGSYYFARVTSKNILDDDEKSQIAVTAPVWFE